MDFEKDLKKLDNVDRATYINVYHKLGDSMFANCYIPNVGDFAKAYKENDEDAKQKIIQITTFTGNTKDIENSATRRRANYTEGESAKFMNSVIAANVTDITASGFFYKKLMSSCDNMRVDMDYDDCGSIGMELSLPIDENTFSYKVRNRFINELDDYASDFESFSEKTKDMTSIHIRTFTTCNHSKNHRCFCKKCAGIYKREHETSFVPKNIGVYSTLMITEHATQASLDSMNNGTSEKLNVLLEQNIDRKQLVTYDNVKKEVNRIIDQIGNVGVESRFYEIALLSRMYIDDKGRWYAAPLVTSFLRQDDAFGAFIYRPNKQSFDRMISAGRIKATSIKSMIALDNF